MKRIIFYMLILAAVLILPTAGMDVGKLQPVQTIAVYREGEAWVIETDTDDIGKGNSVEAAFENLIETTPAVIYLDTADYLILRDNAAEVINELRGRLKDSVALYLYKGEPDLKQVSQYLTVHGVKVKLKQWKTDMELPILDCTTERFFFA